MMDRVEEISENPAEKIALLFGYFEYFVFIKRQFTKNSARKSCLFGKKTV